MSVAKTIALIKALGGGSGGSGGGSAGMIVSYNSSTNLLDKTWGEISAAINEGIPVFIDTGNCISAVVTVGYGMDMYYVLSFEPSGTLAYATESQDDYPSID